LSAGERGAQPPPSLLLRAAQTNSNESNLASTILGHALKENVKGFVIKHRYSKAYNAQALTESLSRFLIAFIKKNKATKNKFQQLKNMTYKILSAQCSPRAAFSSVQGVGFRFAGRVYGAKKAASFKMLFGSVPFSTLDADIDYASVMQKKQEMVLEVFKLDFISNKKISTSFCPPLRHGSPWHLMGGWLRGASAKLRHPLSVLVFGGGGPQQIGAGFVFLFLFPLPSFQPKWRQQRGPLLRRSSRLRSCTQTLLLRILRTLLFYQNENTK
jgi:hypothetical protein